jgi:soluble cytochrome b562
MAKKVTTTKKPAKRKARLDASQNALRVVEQAIGGKLVESNPRRKSHV